MSSAKIILVAGPTASGKSALALDLARQNRGTIINADAMQVYAGLPILSAQPAAEDMAQIPHLLYGTQPPETASSAGVWLEQANAAVHSVLDSGRTPILVGGTGLYFRAFMSGLADIPEIPESVRDETQELYDALGDDAFRQKLAVMDAESAAKLAKNDRQRLIRAYEVAQHTGKPITYWQQQKSKTPFDDFAFERHLLLPPREELYAKCDARFRLMIERGAMDEVREFMKRGLDAALPAMKTIGLREIAAHQAGEITLDEAVKQAQQATRNYAKRQMTWFRNQWQAAGL